MVCRSRKREVKKPTIFLGPDRSGDVLAVSGERIDAFGPPAGPPLAAATMECADARIGPSRVNAHTHIYSGLVPLGMPRPEPAPRNFIEILQTIWWRLDRALDEATLRAAARYYVADALRAGTTTLIDHHESPGFIEGSLDVLADVCQELGMRVILCYGATERNGGREEARRGLEECRRFILNNARPLVRGVVGIHASFTVSDETLREAGEMCRELGTPLHIHLAEGREDVLDARRRGYPGPLERLIQLDGLPAGSILAHGVHLSAEQVRMVEARHCWLVQNPRSNRGNNVGYPRALMASDRVALGTDGYPSRMDEEEEALRQAASAQGEDVSKLERRIQGGWDLVGSLYGRTFSPLKAEGAADAAAWTGGRPRHLVVGGRVIIEEGRLLTADWDEIVAEAEEQAPRLWARVARLEN